MVDWTISDGTVTITLSPGGSFKRTLDKTDSGLVITPVGRQSTPKAKSLKRARDIIVVNTTFRNRKSDVASLFSFIKEETNAPNGEFTFVKGSDSYNVAVRRVIDSEEEGEGDLRYIEIEMEIVQ
jgi:hypothetical protein